MSGQRGVPRVKPPLAPLKDQGCHRFGVVPPDSAGDAAEEVEGGDHAFEDGLGALERQRHDEGGVGVGPGRDEKGDEASAVGEVDVDVAEIGFESPAREVPQRDEGFLMSCPFPPQVALHLGVPASVVMLVAESPIHLGGGMPLFGRRGLVVDQDLIDKTASGNNLNVLRSW